MKAIFLCLLSLLAGLIVGSALLGADQLATAARAKRPAVIAQATQTSSPAVVSAIQLRKLPRDAILATGGSFNPDLAVTNITTYISRGTRFVTPTIKNCGSTPFRGRRTWTLTVVLNGTSYQLTTGKIPEIPAGDIFQPRINLPPAKLPQGTQYVVTLDGRDGNRANDSFVLTLP